MLYHNIYLNHTKYPFFQYSMNAFNFFLDSRNTLICGKIAAVNISKTFYQFIHTYLCDVCVHIIITFLYIFDIACAAISIQNKLFQLLLYTTRNLTGFEIPV